MAEATKYPNSGLAYSVFGAEGFCDYDGEKWSWVLVWGEPPQNPKAPHARIILHQREYNGRPERYITIPLWPPKREDPKEALSGMTDRFFVNVYLPDPNRPANYAAKVTFKARQQQGQQQAPRPAPPATAPRATAPPQQRPQAAPQAPPQPTQQYDDPPPPNVDDTSWPF